MLSDAELAALWKATEPLGYPHGPLYRLLMLTGCRLGEVAGARWKEFKLAERLWTIPAERFKSEQQHLVPLSEDAVSLIENLPRWTGPFVFTTTSGKKPVGDFSSAKDSLGKLMVAELGEAPEPWVNHDIRRTFRTGLAGLRIPDHVAELCIGHARTGIKGVYDRHSYLEERREAFEAWARKLRSIVDPTAAPSNVVSLAAR